VDTNLAIAHERIGAEPLTGLTSLITYRALSARAEVASSTLIDPAVHQLSPMS
jgi:hypothetical protein